MNYCEFCKHYVDKTYTTETGNAICEDCIEKLDKADIKLQSLITEIHTFTHHKEYIERYGE